MTFLAVEVGQTDALVWTEPGGALGVWVLYASIHHPSICYLFTFLSLNFLSVIRLHFYVCISPSVIC